MRSSFTSEQRRIIVACVAVYTALYFCRLNVSAALEGIRQGLALTIPQVGLLQTVFALIYACGQLVNGAVVDHVRPVRHMLTGLLGSAACNLLAGLAPSFPVLLALIACNAAFQSMVWTPIVRLIAQHMETGDKVVRANFFLAFTLVLGHFGAWAISGFLVEMVSWRLSFVVPACIALCVLAWAAYALKEMRLDTTRRYAKRAQQAQNGENTLRILALSGFFPVLAACVLYGFIRDCVVTWTPTLLAHQAQGAQLSSTAFTLIMPAINLVGVTLGFVFRMRGANARNVVVIMMITSIACCVPLSMGAGLLAAAVLLGCICAGMYGANAMLTGLIPMEYDSVGKTGLTAGMVDSFIYLGGALSGYLGGMLYEHFGSVTLFLSWMVTAAVSAMMMMISDRMSKRYWRG